ncbi:redoxin domain-containing protein [Sphingobacterium sp. lm-10]|uniref:peroxiredoxin family protein n=1 Tax=Sphingobacterium sp. lm-10 TaxID=2944904 RepID=UPI0020225907|nr:redoxin domain-containing protein [Sphingobacterium sp. lm-10]MCL7989216.1 redoxin domain-containing protein [Sphingobacterium sp. lm-10]
MNYKPLFLSTVLFVLLGSAGFAQNIQQIPAFQNFVRYDNGNTFTVDSLSKQGVNVLIFYDPGCGHCQELGYEIAENWDQWAPTTSFYFVSMNEKADVDRYIDKYAIGLDEKSNVAFLHDPTGEFITLFDPQNFPSTYIYSASDGQLIQWYDGTNTTRNMAAYLQEK